jgi:hypothetical protein
MLTSAKVGKQNGDTRTRKQGYLNLSIRELTNVRRRRQNDGYQYNDINPIAQKK